MKRRGRRCRGNRWRRDRDASRFPGRAIRLAFVLAFVVLAAGIGSGTSETISFEGTDSGAGVTTQYQDRGVVFEPQGEATVGAIVERCVDNDRCPSAYSGENAVVTPMVRTTASPSAGRHPLVAAFERPQESVGLSVRAFATENGSATATVRAFDGTGEEIAADATAIVPGTGWHRLRVGTRTADIVRVRVTLEDVRGVETNRVLVDDLAYGVNEPPTARLSVDPEPAVVGEAVQFDGSASTDADGEIHTYSWDFDGDGIVDRNTSAASISHEYDEPGTVVAALVVVDDGGATDRATHRIHINDPPRATFDLRPSDPRVGEIVTFDGRGSTDRDGEIVAYRWDVDGDGRFEERGPDPVVEFTYEAAGTVIARLVVVDDEGATNTHRLPVEVAPAVDPSPTSPTAAFIVTTRSPVAGRPVTFDASNSTAATGSIERYTWQFDDGSDPVVSEGPSIAHPFPHPGSYRVRLTVEDSAGRSDTSTRSITVAEAVAVDPVMAIPGTALVDQPVQFDASAVTGAGREPVGYHWDFHGDGTLDERTDGPRATYAFATPGKYPTRVEVVMAAGDRLHASVADPVVVGQPPDATFSYDPQPVRAESDITLDARASGDADGEIIRYEWDFGDDGRVDATGPVVTYAFETAGTEPVSLSVVDDDGFDDELVQSIPVRAGSPAAISLPLLGVASVFTAVAGGSAAVTGAFRTGRRGPTGDRRDARDRAEEGNSDGEGDDGDGGEEPPGGPLRVRQVHVGTDVETAHAEEFVVLANEGDQPVPLYGTTIANGAGDWVRLRRNVRLDPGATVTVYSGDSGDDDRGLSLDAKTALWNPDSGYVLVFGRDDDLLDVVAYG